MRGLYQRRQPLTQQSLLLALAMPSPTGGEGAVTSAAKEKIRETTKNADQVRRSDGAEESRPEIRLYRSRGDAVRPWHRDGRRPDGREGTGVRQRGHSHAAPAKGRADICLGGGMGRRARRDESQPGDGGRWRAR